MKTQQIQHLLLNFGESQVSPLKYQSKHELKLLRRFISGGCRTPWNLCEFEFHVHHQRGWAHVESRCRNVQVLDSFIAAGTNDAACWGACMEHFHHLTSRGLMPHMPVLLQKPASIPWCASLYRLGLDSLSEDEAEKLAFLERTIAWAVYFEFRRDGADPAQVGA